MIIQKLVQHIQHRKWYQWEMVPYHYYIIKHLIHFKERFIKIKNQADCQRRYKKKNNASQGRTQIGHQPKGSARIVDVGDVKETIYYGYVIIKWQVTQNQPFGELIQQNNSPGDNHQLYIFVLQHIFLKGSEVLGSAFRV